MSSHANSDEEPTTKRAKTHQESTDADVLELWRQAREQAERKRDEAIRKRDEEIRKRDEAIRKREEAERKKEEAESTLEELERLLSGTYYATFNEVWDSEPVRFTGDDYTAMIRDKVPEFNIVDCKVKTPFDETLKKAEYSSLIPADDDHSARTSHGNPQVKVKIWPVEILKSKLGDPNDPTSFMLPTCTDSGSRESDQDQEEASRVTPRSISQIAHLIPASAVNASLYHHVAVWVFGLKKRTPQPLLVQKLIHGSKPSNSKPQAKRAKRSGQRVPQSGQRETGTGLKHMICNKIRLAGQYQHYHKNPRVIIVPVLTLQQAKEWNGQSYQAIFMISTGNKNVALIRNVAADVHLLSKDEVASKPEIEEARKLLTATLKALAHALVDKSGKRLKWVKDLRYSESLDKLKELRDNAASITGEKAIRIPKLRQGNEKPVRKIIFGPAFGPRGKFSHPAPDPILLVVKAATNWSAYHGEKLMAGGSDDDSNSETSGGSLAAKEEYIAMQEQYERANRDQEIVDMEIFVS